MNNPPFRRNASSQSSVKSSDELEGLGSELASLPPFRQEEACRLFAAASTIDNKWLQRFIRKPQFADRLRAFSATVDTNAGFKWFARLFLSHYDPVEFQRTLNEEPLFRERVVVPRTTTEEARKQTRKDVSASLKGDMG